MAAPVVVGTPLRTSFAAVTGPQTGTVAGGPFKAGDIVCCFLRAGTTGAVIAPPSGWVNPLGGNTVVSTSSHSVACVYHKLTAAEQIAGTAAWTLTGLYGSTQTGANYTAIIRGVDLLTVIDSYGTKLLDTTTTSHVLAGITGLRNNSLILSGVGGDSTQTYATAPTGWTFQAKNPASTNTGAILTLDAPTVYGVDQADTIITASSASKYASISLAFNAIKTKPGNYNRSVLDRVAL